MKAWSKKQVQDRNFSMRKKKFLMDRRGQVLQSQITERPEPGRKVLTIQVRNKKKLWKDLRYVNDMRKAMFKEF